MSHNDAVAVYKNTNYDLRYHKRLQMFVHANAMEQNTTNLQNSQLALFLRLGSDYNNNYYEYEIPLKLTAPGVYSTYSNADCAVVWPAENMLNIELKKLTALKKQRNIMKAQGKASLTNLYSEYDPDNQNNKISIVGNPSLGEVRTMMIGVRNLSAEMKDGEVWVNELRLLEPERAVGRHQPTLTCSCQTLAPYRLRANMSATVSADWNKKYLSEPWISMAHTP